METINNKINVIRNIFNEERELAYVNGDELKGIDLFGGDLFKTQNSEYVYLALQLDDFTPDELAKYARLAEELYEINPKLVTIYILCPTNVQVKVSEMEIKSEADFTIKLACTQINPCEVILEGIKNKLTRGELLDDGDKEALYMLPMMCDVSERTYYRTECFKILSEV